MIFTWFKIFNLAEFSALDLVSKKYTLILEGIGQKDILVTKGNMTSILYDGVFLPIQMNDENPFIFDTYAVYIDGANDVYLGVPDED